MSSGLISFNSSVGEWCFPLRTLYPLLSFYHLFEALSLQTVKKMCDFKRLKGHNHTLVGEESRAICSFFFPLYRFRSALFALCFIIWKKMFLIRQHRVRVQMLSMYLGNFSFFIGMKIKFSFQIYICSCIRRTWLQHH